MTIADRLSARTVHTNPEHEDTTKTLNGQKQAQSEANPVVSGRGDGMLDASLALLLARYQQRTVLKIQGASHTRSHDRVSAKGPPWMEMERED